ncbi:MAG: FAD/NAD(P)-binding protein, partial [Rhodocyclaceae bacterium]
MFRREFLLSLAGGVLAAGCRRSGKSRDGTPEGDLYGTSHRTGHLLRDGRFPAPTQTIRTPVAIIGAGIGGLCAGWRLQRAGCEDFAIFEMERDAGGNSRYGENAVSAYPWGAHYLPLPTRESRAVRELLADLGVLQGDPHALQPRYDERFLCAAPQERLYRNGWWQEGLMPQAGVSRSERDQQARFHDR